MEDYRVRYQQWLDDPFIDEETKAELRGITDENEIKERFFKELEFGTGGLRHYRQRQQQTEPLYRWEGFAGTGKLYQKGRHTEAGRSDCIRFPFHVSRICGGGRADFCGKRDSRVCISLSAPRSHAFLCGERAGLYGRGCADGKP